MTSPLISRTAEALDRAICEAAPDSQSAQAVMVLIGSEHLALASAKHIASWLQDRGFYPAAAAIREQLN